MKFKNPASALACILVCMAAFAPPVAASEGASACQTSQTLRMPDGSMFSHSLRVRGTHIEFHELTGDGAEFAELTFCGPWLDITSEVVTTGRLSYRGEIAKGVDDRFVAGRTARPYFTGRFRIDRGRSTERTGTIVLKRPGVPGMGSHEARFSYELVPSIRLQEWPAPVRIDISTALEPQTLRMTGAGLMNVRRAKTGLPANQPVEAVRILRRLPNSLEVELRFRQRTGSVDVSSLFQHYLELTPNATVIFRRERENRLVALYDSTRAPTPAPVSSRGPVVTEGSATEAQGPGGGGVRLPGRGAGPATPQPPGAHAPAPDLVLAFRNTFTSSGAGFRNNDINSYQLCPGPRGDRRAYPLVRHVPDLEITVTNLGGGASPATTLAFARGANQNFASDQAFNVPALGPGESRVFALRRGENRVCATQDCRRCGDGLLTGPVIPTVVDEKGKVVSKPLFPADDRIFHWDDIGVSATLGNVPGDANLADNAMTLR